VAARLSFASSAVRARRIEAGAPADSAIALRIAPGFDLARALAGGRLAVGDSDSVPAGRYARGALTSLGAWTAVVDRLARAENVRAALSRVARKETPLGIVYATDARVEPGVRVVDVFPAETHLPIHYPVAATRASGPADDAFLAFLEGDEAREALQRHGFILR
jgi:molybdate transport system substrate-binding protein